MLIDLRVLLTLLTVAAERETAGVFRMVRSGSSAADPNGGGGLSWTYYWDTPPFVPSGDAWWEEVLGAAVVAGLKDPWTEIVEVTTLGGCRYLGLEGAVRCPKGHRPLDKTSDLRDLMQLFDQLSQAVAYWPNQVVEGRVVIFGELVEVLAEMKEGVFNFRFTKVRAVAPGGRGLSG